VLAARLLVPLSFIFIALVLLVFSVRRLRGDGNSVSGKPFLLRRAVLSSLAVLSIFVIVSTSFNSVAHDIFAAKHPAPGKIYLVHSRRMHLWCVGQGEPTIVLEAGLGNDSLIWGRMQPELAKTTRVCSYDRAGMGWSEVQPGPRDSAHIAEELHELLIQAGIDGPIILMGHSAAGLHMRAYAARYPASLAGVVMVDTTVPGQSHYGPPDLRAKMEAIPWRFLLLRTLSVELGLPRLLGHCAHRQGSEDWGMGDLQAEDQCDPAILTQVSELLQVPRDDEEAARLNTLGDLPLLIVSRDPNLPSVRSSRSQLAIEGSEMWDQLQESEKKLSTNSWRVIAKGSDHDVQVQRPEVLIREVPLLVERVRSRGAGTTPIGASLSGLGK